MKTWRFWSSVNFTQASRKYSQLPLKKTTTIFTGLQWMKHHTTILYLPAMVMLMMLTSSFTIIGLKSKRKMLYLTMDFGKLTIDSLMDTGALTIAEVEAEQKYTCYVPQRFYGRSSSLFSHHGGQRAD